MKPRLSGWCSGPIGCYSPTDHKTCQDRQDRGILRHCDCTEYGGHAPKGEPCPT